jgi:RNA polymerase sigma-70 factor (ECF subfamily)
MEGDNTSPLTNITGSASNARIQIIRFIENESESLLSTLTRYVSKAGLGQGVSSKEIALEIMSETVLDALEHAERFDTKRPTMAWLLGIAVNHIKRRLTKRGTQARREPVISDLCGQSYGPKDHAEFFDKFAALGNGGEQALEANEQAKGMLSLVSGEDAEILRLSVVCGLNGDELAQHLNIKPGAARVRLYRALNRLRDKWNALEKDGHYE